MPVTFSSREFNRDPASVKRAAPGERLRRWLDGVVKPAFAGRVLALDAPIAAACAALHVSDPVGERDGWIAATALVHGLAVVTDNVADFAGTGVRLLDPWSEGRADMPE